MLASFAPAKVNLYLHVTGRRADGYHLLDSLAVFPNVGDWVTAAPADALSLEISGAFSGVLQSEPDNLLLRAARLLHPERGVMLGLEKNLPVASGIGGGSADAAAALRLLARLWSVEGRLHEAALALGADVPVCLARAPACMSGIGEVLRPAPKLPRFGIVLVNPGVAVPTPAVFRARGSGFSEPARLPEHWPTVAAMVETLASLSNGLQEAAIGIQPAISKALETLAALPGALLTRMSGSGATCFALFETPDQAAEAAALINPAHWWRWGGGLYEPAPTDL